MTETLDLSIFNNASFITLFLSGIVVWIVGIYVLKNPPKKINRLYGYRTPRAMKSQEAWDYAQLHGTRRMISGAKLMVAFSIISLFFKFSEVVGSGIAILIILLCLLTPLIMTEKDLKERFENT